MTGSPIWPTSEAWWEVVGSLGDRGMNDAIYLVDRGFGGFFYLLPWLGPLSKPMVLSEADLVFRETRSDFVLKFLLLEAHA